MNVFIWFKQCFILSVVLDLALPGKLEKMPRETRGKTSRNPNSLANLTLTMVPDMGGGIDGDLLSVKN
jgi:hypothetical protein